jgi:hypothetical protein
MEQLRYLLILSLILLSSSCSLINRQPEPEIITVTKVVTPVIPIAERPKQLDMSDVDWYVVTERNMDEFLEKFEKDNGDIVFMAISVRGYENISLNLADLRRYILQQKEIIVYYEDSVKPKEDNQKEIVTDE